MDLLVSLLVIAAMDHEAPRDNDNNSRSNKKHMSRCKGTLVILGTIIYIKICFQLQSYRFTMSNVEEAKRQASFRPCTQHKAHNTFPTFYQADIWFMDP